MKQVYSYAPSTDSTEKEKADQEEENNVEIGLVESFNSCDIRIGFLKDFPIQDDCYEGWLEKMKQHPNYKKRFTVSGVLEHSEPSLTYQQERTAILNYIADENGFTGMESFGDADYERIFQREFVEIMRLNDLEFSQLSKLVRPAFKRIGMYLRDCLFNFKSSHQLINRDDIFRHRLKWIIPLSESTSIRNLLHFDPSYEFDDGLKINSDICLEDLTKKHKLFIMFSHSNLNDAFNSEEFYKMISLLLLTITYHKSNDPHYKYFEPSGLICCRTHAYYLNCYYSSININICKIDLQTVNGMFVLFFIISNFFGHRDCERAYCRELKELKNPTIKKNIKGIEKSKRMILNRKIENKPCIPLLNITNLMMKNNYK
ncbi:predicted protein [Naegleria gruberi]|uniref:Predicted protein n=1 Tax=Naegleria gruberi TaxID=5762 RepID=D2VT85_NAEGR|nr:uncharacterized protein NAEGRDRAFT_72211 [Naegleria gruberi]EFC40039.1 predicted protein [Naegleria gruberi]|eukprot:XP_002672783.1 predicted protein [Naegleria gruberi strain NEG-M]